MDACAPTSIRIALRIGSQLVCLRLCQRHADLCASTAFEVEKSGHCQRCVCTSRGLSRKLSYVNHHALFTASILVRNSISIGIDVSACRNASGLKYVSSTNCKSQSPISPPSGLCADTASFSHPQTSECEDHVSVEAVVLIACAGFKR